MPPGWDRWAANAGGSEDYYSYTLDQCPAAFGTASSPSCSDGPATSVAYDSDPVLDYHTTVVTRLALQFLDTAPSNEPFFLYFAPFAPHGHHVPEPKYRGAYAGVAPTVLPGLQRVGRVRQAGLDPCPSGARRQPGGQRADGSCMT